MSKGVNVQRCKIKTNPKKDMECIIIEPNVFD